MIESSPQPQTLTVRRGERADLGDVMTVMEAAFDPQYGEGWTRSQCAGILPMPGVRLVLARNGRSEPLGFALWRTVAGDSELLLLAVAPAHRRSGVGRRLLGEFVDEARNQGVSRVHLEVRDGNPAIAMYESAGFTPVGRRHRYYRGKNGEQFDALTFAREL
jgi:ribosomal-protein-alanine N-acetyltransferase